MADGIPYPPSAPALHFGGYAPGVTPNSGAYLFQGISGLGSGIAQGLQLYEKNKKENEQRDAIVDFLAQNYPEAFPQDTKGTGPPTSALDRYHSASESDKNKIMLSAYTGYMDIIRKQKMQEELARANLYNTQAAGYNAPAQITPFDVPGQDPVYGLTQPGHPAQLLNKGISQGQGPNVQWVDDPNNPGKKIPFVFDPSKGWTPVHQPSDALAQVLGVLAGGGAPGVGGGGGAPTVSPTPSGQMPSQPTAPTNLPQPGDVIPDAKGNRYQYNGPPNSQAGAQDPNNWTPVP